MRQRRRCGLRSLYYMYRWHGIASAKQPAEAGVLDTLRYQRRQLERQRDAGAAAGAGGAAAVRPGALMLFVELFFEITPVPWKAIILNAVVVRSDLDGDRDDWAQRAPLPARDRRPGFALTRRG